MAKIKKFKIQCTRCCSNNVEVISYQWDVGYTIRCNDCGNETEDFNCDTISIDDDKVYNY